MKTKTFARLSLFLPNLVLIESAFYFVYHKLDNKLLSVTQNFNYLWNFLAIFWFIPYTILVIGLLIWSKEKSNKEIEAKFETSPFILIGTATATYMVVFLIGIAIDINSAATLFWGFLLLTVFSVIGSIILGFTFIIITHLLYKLLQTIKFIKD